jgi:signal transduction histidine kinase
MLGNLLDNACNWAEAEVRLSATGQSGRLRVTVEDDGPGMEEGAIEHALVRGARLDESRAGHGLGLAIVTALATQHGAALRLDASPLGGLRATLDLPAAA